MRLFDITSDYKKPLTLEEAVNMARTDTYRRYIELFEDVPAFYRGMVSKTSDYVFVNTGASEVERVSRNTTNEYNEILSHSPNWRQYPKRSKSIIGSMSPKVAYSYGYVYAVILPENASVGVCPAIDLWHSFGYMNNKTGISQVHHFNEQLRNIFALYLQEPTPISRSFTYEEIREFLGRIQQMMLDDSEKPSLQNNLHKYFKKILPEVSGDSDGLFKAAVDLLDPEKNDFDVADLDRLLILRHFGYEAWTSDPCLLVKFNEYNDFLQKVLD